MQQYWLSFHVRHTRRVTEGVRRGIRQRVERRSSTGATRHWALANRRLDTSAEGEHSYMFLYETIGVLAEIMSPSLVIAHLSWF